MTAVVCDLWQLFDCYRHDIEKLTNDIVNKTTSDLRQLSSLTAQTPDNRVSECPMWLSLLWLSLSILWPSVL